MNVVLDKFGRVLIPKRVRDQLGLKPGTELRLETGERAISLIPAEDERLLDDEGGVLVFTGKLTGEAAGAVGQLRNERMRKLAGL